MATPQEQHNARGRAHVVGSEHRARRDPLVDPPATDAPRPPLPSGPPTGMAAGEAEADRSGRPPGAMRSRPYDGDARD
jgi:hypothetical protein